ncbi:putative disease resistance protein RGA1 [Bienertia sinuspersici]
MGKIFKSFTGKDHQNRPLEEIKQGIRDTIESNKYLLVLDDLWDEGGDRLIDLVNLLKCGKQGSKVIVTTRSGVVARIVGTNVPYKLGTLTPDQSWDLFKMLAFKQENQNNNPVFSVIGKEIVTMCSGWTRASKNDSEQRQLLLPRLLSMNVVDCPELMSMPQAPKLESLIVENIEWKVFESNVASHDDEKAAASWSISSAASPTLFTSLKELSMTSVTSLVWLSISSSLCNLNELTIVSCEELRSLRFESTNSIQKLEIMKCKRLRNIDGLQYLSFLERLQIIGGEVLEMEEEAEEGNTKTNINITTTSDNRGCQSQWQGLTRLRHLELMTIPKWKKLPSGIACLTTLKQLSVSDLESLIEFPQDIGNLCLLDRLYICECPNLKSLPISLRGLTSLKSLCIKECPHLEERYKRPDGEDCHLIQHIPNVMPSRWLAGLSKTCFH